VRSDRERRGVSNCRASLHGVTSSGQTRAARGARRRRQSCRRADSRPAAARAGVCPRRRGQADRRTGSRCSIGITCSLPPRRAEPERKVGVGRSRVFEVERAVQGSERESERVRVGHSGPQPHRGSTAPDQPHFSGAIPEPARTAAAGRWRRAG
jgi:hypothetical protein